MENNVVSLETAKKLKAAGFPQEYKNYHWYGTPDKHWRLDNYRFHSPFYPEDYEFYIAPTAQEIADQLRILISGQHIEIESMFKGWAARVGGDESWCEGDTICEALTALWLKLKSEPPEGELRNE